MLTRDRWSEIVRFKHPALAGHEKELRECVRDPDLVRESLKDPGTHLYYRSSRAGYVCVVVGGADPHGRFVITAYFTARLKKGRELWAK